MYLVAFKNIWNFTAILFIFGSAFLFFENLYMYNTMEAELEARKDPDYEADEDNLENMSPYHLHNMLYFMMVTMSSVGYGDITPVTAVGRWIVILAIIFFLSFISTLASSISKMNTLSS